MKIKLLIIIVLSIAFLGCSSQSEQGNQRTRAMGRKLPSEDSLIKLNQSMVVEEAKLIDNYLHRHALSAQTGEGGLRYHIYKNGSGPCLKKFDKVRFNYEIRFLTGDLIYSSRTEGFREATLGKTTLETGLYYAFLHMRVGDRAKIVLPSHLAFGAGGDGKNIPPRTSLVYDIEIIDTNQ